VLLEKFYGQALAAPPNGADQNWWEKHIKDLHSQCADVCRRCGDLLSKSSKQDCESSLYRLIARTSKEMSASIEKFLLWKFSGERHQNKRTTLLNRYKAEEIDIDGILSAK
jgi:hypothetical protein